MKLLLAASTALALSVPVQAHHGPFSQENKVVHDMHLGVTRSTNKEGSLTAYSIKSKGLGRLVFGRMSQGGPKVEGFEIDTNEIIGYGPGGAETANSFNSVNAGAGVAVGMALAAPLMLPIALLTSGSSSTSYSYTLLEMNERARVVPRLITLFSEKDVQYFNDFLAASTGLLPGEQPTGADLDRVRKAKLNNALDALSDAKKRLITSNEQKPWCSRLDFEKSPEDTAVYRNLLDKVNAIKAALGLDSMTEEVSISGDDKYQDYLESAPHLKVWAEANPVAAEKFKSCPST
ncbi:hypothetical protein [Synechococcus sp. MU1642]|uniref:hypothetical protein n=1 Tax=Synechococcus sp. MU1642 TaxID=2508348 RepID=UPI001CF877EC|nr:hypothetical protein [Synechococcus sp. MU1642]MCB4407939.1 hypothetical protein [Synechococcus sp. MU1642]